MPYRMTMKSNLGDKLSIAGLSGTEQLGRLFSYQLRMRSEDYGLDLRSLLGSEIAVTYEDEDGNYMRYFHGIVAEASQTGLDSFQGKEYAGYSATLVPKPWLLLHKVNCRIYVNKSVPDIVKAVLADSGYSDIKNELSGSYPTRDYCVQYREDCFNFISRLMEQEGIYYYFQHGESAHTMVLADALGAHSTTSGFATLPFVPQTGTSGVAYEAAIIEFAQTRSVHTLKYSLTDYDPLKPKLSLLSSVSAANADGNHAVSNLESFDYPGAHVTPEVGRHYAQMRVEALNAVQSQFHGATNAGGLLTGALFTLKGHAQKAFDQEYLVVGSSVRIDNPAQGGEAADGGAFSCSFSAIKSQQPFRNMPSAGKPMIVGLQTAIVTGSETDEDIAVDQYGRVQVNFHWDMPDRPDAHCSCPVRVASPWAGKSWGAVSIPRVGQEVVVSFIEGDPDRPLIIGSVYNAANTVPYGLPDNKTQSGIKSRSLLGDTADFNELRFEDKKGEEDFFIHAQKDMHEEVEHDHLVTIDNDETCEVKQNQTLTVGKDQTETIKHDRKATVQNDDNLTVTANGTTKIGQTFKLDAGTEINLVCGASSITLKASGDIEIKGVNIKVTGNAAVNVDAGADMTVQAKGVGTVKASMLQLTGTGMAKLGGGIVMIG